MTFGFEFSQNRLVYIFFSDFVFSAKIKDAKLLQNFEQTLKFLPPPPTRPLDSWHGGGGEIFLYI